MSLLFRNRSSAKGSAQGARQVKISGFRRFVMFFVHNAQQAVGSLGELARYPFASMMTMAVLGLSLTLPATLYVVVKNTQTVGAQWQEASELTLFLQKGLTEREVETFTRRVGLDKEVASVELIPKAEALEEFKEYSGFGEALDYLNSNPLPDVLLVTPAESMRSAAAAQSLLQRFEREREVDFGKLDVQWLNRLQSLLDLVRDSFGALAFLLCVSVVLIVGNTIRLNILSKRDEIVVMKLVGATDGYIQRPFLYTGLWYGIVGGVIAWLATFILLWWIDGAVMRITELYEGQFELAGLTGTEMLILWAVAIALGLIGSYLAVRKHVSAIEPR
ncbi:MAG: permease-like cell division protein FtsX [Idiomarina sp.]